MKMKKKKEDNILSGTPKRQNSKKVQLKNMLKSMEDRSDPVTTHRVVTNYFDRFREERNIPRTETKHPNTTAVDTAVITDIDTAVVRFEDTCPNRGAACLSSDPSRRGSKSFCP